MLRFVVILARGPGRFILLVAFLLPFFFQPADAEETRWGFGTDLGVWTGTTNGSVFALGLHLDYYMDRNFSFGGMTLFTPVGDLTQIAMAGVAKYHLRFSNGVNLVPFAGLGLIHADLDRGSGPGKIDRNDTSHLIPLGLSLEYQVGPTIAFSSTLMVNLHHLTLSPPSRTTAPASRCCSASAGDRDHRKRRLAPIRSARFLRNESSSPFHRPTRMRWAKEAA
jgi:hypothetical protein